MYPPCRPSSTSGRWSGAHWQRAPGPIHRWLVPVRRYPFGAVHHGPTHRNLLRARAGHLSTMQVMRWWRQKITCTVIPAHLCSFCAGPEEGTGHMRILCARDEAVARLLSERVEEFTAELSLADRAMEFLAWKEHGCRWTESLMTGVRPGTQNGSSRRCGAVITGLSEGQAVHVGHDPYWGRCVRQEEPSAHSDHATTDARSDEGRLCVPTG